MHGPREPWTLGYTAVSVRLAGPAAVRPLPNPAPRPGQVMLGKIRNTDLGHARGAFHRSGPFSFIELLWGQPRAGKPDLEAWFWPRKTPATSHGLRPVIVVVSEEQRTDVNAVEMWPVATNRPLE